MPRSLRAPRAGCRIAADWESAGPPFTSPLANGLRESLRDQPATLAGIDAACWDWAGKNAGIPVHRLVANAMPASDTPAAIGMTIGIASFDEAIEKTRAAVAQGFSILKVKLGSNSVSEDVALMEGIRKVAPTATLRIDANEGWRDEHIARAHLAQLARFDIELVEQPLPRDHLDACGRLRRSARFRGTHTPAADASSMKTVSDSPTCLAANPLVP